MKNKRGYFFSLDAFIALMIIIGVVLFIKPPIVQTSSEIKIQDDMLNTLSHIQIGELNNSIADILKSTQLISNLNQSVLDQMGEFYAIGNSTYASALVASVIANLNLSKNTNIGIYFNNYPFATFGNVPYNNAEDIFTAREIISGVQNGTSLKGYSSRAFLSSQNKVDYFYFGGYVGDGNITVRIDGDVLSSNIEGVFSGNFDLYINNQYAGNYSPTSNVPYKIDLTPYLNKFSPGTNYIDFKSDSNLYIAGGYVKVIYNGSNELYSSNKRYLPGINGLINIYDSFYVLGNLNYMNIFLHYNSSYNIFLSIGNKTVYKGNSSGGEINVNLSNANLSGILDYPELSNKTVPFRLGFENASYTQNITVPVDTFSVTDLSGSMCECTNVSQSPTQCRYDQANCENSALCGVGKVCQGGIYEVKAANDVFINSILNSSSNRIGLVGYRDLVYPADVHDLSNDNASLHNLVSTWKSVGSTCICCGENEALKKMIDLAVYYKFDGNYNDDSLGSLTATVFGSPSFVSGKYGQALNFKGASDYLSTAKIYPVADQGTISFWFKPNRDINSSLSTTQGIWSKIQNNNNNAFIAFKGSDLSGFSSTPVGAIQAKLEYGGSTSSVRTTTTIWSKNTWYHISLTWGGGLTKIYVNGVQEGSTGSSKSLAYNANHTFGRSSFDTSHLGSPRYFNGSLDELRIYPRTLNSTEVSYLAGSSSTCGNGNVESTEACDDGNNINNDACGSCSYGSRSRSLVVMSDGEANVNCAQQGTGNSKQDAIQAACDAYNNYGVTSYSIGFGPSADETTLEDLAVTCGHGGYYYANINEIANIYNQVAQDIITASYVEQTITGSGINTKLFPDSYISLGHDSEVPYGLVVNLESDIFNNNISQGNFSIPEGTKPYEVGVVSYSGPKWTDLLQIYNSTDSSWNKIFSLGDYNTNYTQLGDPYIVNIPPSKILLDGNSVKISTGVAPGNSSGGSAYDKVIYSVYRDLPPFTPIVSTAEGCIWKIQFQDNSNMTIALPSNYSGSNFCNYTSLGVSYNDNDAVQLAVYDLLTRLDFDSDHRVDSKFSEDSFTISSVEVQGIPFTWETEVQVRTWR